MTNKIILINVRELIAHEKVDIPHAIFIYLKMIFTRRFDFPILVDARTKIILDGHHRCYAANRLGLRLVPCFMVDYLNDPSITVSSRRINIAVDKEIVVRMGLSEGVFPQKTTRHKYKISSFQPVELSELR